MSAQFLGGAAGIVLGILALLGMYPAVLLPVAAIVFGGTLLMACGTTARLNTLVIERHTVGHEAARHIAGDMVSAASGVQALVGLAGIILGILGLVGMFPWTLSLVAFLCVGGAVLLSGAAVSSKMLSMLRG
jgi:hypothetical protein